MKKMITILLIAILPFISGCNLINSDSTIASHASSDTQNPTQKLSPPLTYIPHPLPSLMSVPTGSPAPSPTTDPMIALARGGFDGNVYTNEYFGMTMQMPSSWIVGTANEQALFAERVTGLFEVTGINPRTIYTDFTISDNPVNSICAEMAMICLNIDSISNTMTEENFLASFGQASTVKINGTKFAKVSIKISELKKDTIYCKFCKGYVLLFLIFARDEKSASALDNAMKTVKFN